MFGYIYITENLINHKQYIGQKRSNKFLGTKYLGSGTYLKNAVNKYGKENFKVTLLDTANTKEELDEKEIYYISKYNAQKDPNFYNISAGGDCGVGGPKFKGHKHTEESKRKIGESCKGELNGFYGKHHTKETKELMKVAWNQRKQTPVSEETRKKMSESKKGIKFTEEHRKRISEAQKGEKGNNWGKKQPQEIKDRISKKISNQVWINNGIVCKRVDKNIVPTYIENGFVLGRLSFKKGSTTIQSISDNRNITENK